VEFAIAQGRQRRMLEEKIGLIPMGGAFSTPSRMERYSSNARTGHEDSHGAGGPDISSVRAERA